MSSSSKTEWAGRCVVCDYSPDTPNSLYHITLVDPIHLHGNKMVTTELCARCHISHTLTINQEETEDAVL